MTETGGSAPHILSRIIGETVSAIKRGLGFLNPAALPMDRKVLIILAAGVALRLLFFTGLIGRDDLIYNRAAYDLMAGNDFALGNPGQNRLGLIIPLAAAFKLWGVNEVSSSLVTLIPSVLLILLTFYIARYFFGKETGYFAAILQAVYPMDVYYATVLYPDIPTALFVVLGVYLFHRACQDKGDLYLFLSGLSVGLAYLVKMTGLFAAPFLIGYTVYIMRKEGGVRWRFLWTPLGFMAVFITELFFYHATKGDLFFRFHTLSIHNLGPWSGLSMYLERGYAARLITQYPQTLLFYFPHFGLFYWFTFAAMGYLLVIKEKRAYFPMVWWLILYLTLNFGSTSISQYVPLVPLSRYSFILLLPANIILACALIRLGSIDSLGKWTRVAGYSALVILLSSSILITVVRHERGSTAEREMSTFFNRKPDKPVYTDPRTIKLLEYFFEYNNTDMLRDFTEVELKSVNNSYVLVNFRRLIFLNMYYGTKFQPALFNPPPSWRQVVVFSPDRGPNDQPSLTNRAAILYSIDK